MEVSVAVPTSLNSSQNIDATAKNAPENNCLSIEDTTMSPEPVVEQQKNKGTKRKASSEIQLYTCEVCQVKLNSASQAYQHFQGKSHIGKVKMLEMAAEVKPPPVISPPVTNNLSVPQNQPHSTSVLAPSTIKHYCSLCKKIFNSQMQADQHFSGKAHRHKLSEDAISKTSPYSSSGYMLGNSSTTGDHSAGINIEMPQDDKQPEAKLGVNIKCQLYSCGHCHITLNSPRQFSQHVNGLRHKIIVGKAKPPPPPQAEEPGWQEIRYKKLTTAMTTVGLMKNQKNIANINPAGGTQLGHEYYCKDCDISVNSPLQLQQHMTSAKHKARMEGIAKGAVVVSKKKPKGRGAGATPTIKYGRVLGRGRSLPSITSSFVKAGEISTFYTTQTVQSSPVQPIFNASQATLSINGAIPSQYSSYSHQQYQMQTPPFSTQMF